MVWIAGLQLRVFCVTAGRGPAQSHKTQTHTQATVMKRTEMNT